MKNRNLSQWIIALTAAVLLAACASTPEEPTLGDRMRVHSDDMQRQADLRRELAAQWDEGAELVSTGENRIERNQRRLQEAEEAMERAQDRIRTGNQEVTRGQRMMNESERRFREEFPDASLEENGSAR